MPPKHRNVTDVDDETWDWVKRVAGWRGETIGDVLSEAIRVWAMERHDTLPSLPSHWQRGVRSRPRLRPTPANTDGLEPD